VNFLAILDADWEGKEEAIKSATWNLIQLYLRETPITPDEKPEAVEVGTLI
jgi:hypothetical protein